MHGISITEAFVAMRDAILREHKTALHEQWPLLYGRP